MYQDSQLSPQVDTSLPKQVLLHSYVLPLALALVFLLGVGLRFLALSDESYWIDEIKMISLAQGSIETIFDEWQVHGRPPVYILLAHSWVRLFGASEWATRALSALAGSLALLALWLVGRELLGPRVALLATLLMAVSEFQIEHAQEFRYYPLFLLLALLSWLSYIRALKTGRGLAFAAYAVINVALCYTHTYGLFVLLAQGLYFVLRAGAYRPLWLRWLLAQTAISLGLLPFVLILMSKSARGANLGPEWIPDPPLWAPALTVVKYILPGRHFPALAILGLALLVVAVGVSVFAWRTGMSRWRAEVAALPRQALRLASRERASLLLLGLWAVCPILLPFALSKIMDPMYLHRYTIAAAPAVYLLLALGLVSLRRVVPEAVVVGALVVLIAPGLYEYYTTPLNEQWREAAALVSRQAEADDVVVFAPAEGGTLRDNFYWYYQGALPACELDVTLDTPAAISAQLSQCSTDKQRLWLVMRGSEKRVASFSDYFLQDARPDIALLHEQHLHDVSVYLFKRITRG